MNEEDAQQPRIGYSTNIAVKMTELANTNGVVIGQSLYDVLDHEKSSFSY